MHMRSALRIICAEMVLSSMVVAQQDEKQGRVITSEGDVQVSADQAATWRAIGKGEAIFDRNILKTGRRSRAAVLLLDETQLLLNAYTTLEIQKVSRGGKVVPASGAHGPTETSLRMGNGEAWARSKNPNRSLAIETPAATAAIRGTEVNLRVDGDASEITVVEGLVDLYNDAGSITLRGGEGGRAEAGKPPQKILVLSPDDAVQWVLHFPEPERIPSGTTTAEAAALTDRLGRNPADSATRRRLIGYHTSHQQWEAVLDLATYPQAVPADQPALLRARIEASSNLGRDVDEALLAEAVGIQSSAPLLVVVADYHLRVGDPASAKKDLSLAIRIDPTNQDALALRGLIAVVRNDMKLARELVERSLAVDPNHAETQLMACRVSQAQFDLDAALQHADAARRLAPESTEAAASSAEILFGSGRPGEAAAIVDEMLKSHPDSPRLLTVSGFLSLALGRNAIAEELFDRAITLAPEASEAHLGLGISQFHRGKRDEGLVEMLTASVLAPSISLYESYLGKAYYEKRRFGEAFAALDTAKRLDPRDPTPHLYSALLKRNLNRPGEAVRELQQAIAKNNNRAVYRSRYLLDHDQATSNVSLANIYNDIGFSAQGAYQAVKSLELDLGSSSGHIFSSGVLIAEPDRTAAAASEFLVGKLLLPVNQSSFAGFNEYTSLLSTPRTTWALTAEGGEEHYRKGVANVYGGNDRLAYYALVTDQRHDGFLGPNSDSTFNVWNALAKVSLTPTQSLYFESTGARSDEGFIGEGVEILIKDGLLVPIRFVHPSVPDLDDRFNALYSDNILGYHFSPAPNHHLLITASFERTGIEGIDYDFFFQPDDFDPMYWDCGRREEGGDERVGFQAQHQFSSGPHQVVYGVEALRQEQSETLCIFCDKGPLAGVDVEYSRFDGMSTYGAVYGRYILRAKHDSTITLGARFDKLSITDDINGLKNPKGRYSEVTPQLGVRWQIRPSTSLRLAAFRHLASHESARLAPQLIAGFATTRTEFGAGALTDEADVAVEFLLPREGFLSVGGYYRKIKAPAYYLTSDEEFPLLRDATRYHVSGLKADYNLCLTRLWTLSNSIQFRRIALTAYDQDEFQDVVSLTFVHPRGWRFRLDETFLRQTFESHVGEFPAPDSSAFFTDLSFSKELAHKRVFLGLTVSNLFDRDFNILVEGISVKIRRPYRQASGYVQVVF
ncbi:MAG: TonB-dependent receptor [Acidobacteria bacterium]|nr:TonB-dependent receptor [Acidobacteriota bacterium]